MQISLLKNGTKTGGRPPVLSEGEATLVFERINTNPPFSEYNRKFGVKIGKQQVQMYDIGMDVGGGKRMNFFEYEFNGEKWIRVKDRFGEYVFNMSNGEAIRLARVEDIPFTGKLNNQGVRTLITDNDLSTIEVSFGEHKAKKDLRFLNEGRFVGSLHGLKYFSAEELKYKKIENIRG